MNRFLNKILSSKLWSVVAGILIVSNIIFMQFGYVDINTERIKDSVERKQVVLAKQYSSIKQTVSADILSPVRDFVSKYLLPDYGYETYLVADPHRSIESRITNLESKLFITSQQPSPQPLPPLQPGTIVIREFVPQGTDVSSIINLEQRINTVSAILSNLSDNFTSYQRITPTTLVLPPTNTTGIGPITSNPDVVSTGTLTVTGGSTLSGLSLSSDLTVDTSVFKVDTSNNRVGINTSSPETSFEVVGTASISTLIVSSNLSVSGIITGLGAVASDNIDFDELKDTLTLDANTTISSNSFSFTITDATTTIGSTTFHTGGNVGIGTTSPASRLEILGGRFEVGGTASASYLLTGNTLQVGGYSSAAYSRFGTNTTGHSLSSSNDLLISGLLEVDGNSFFDGKVFGINSEFQGTSSASYGLFNTLQVGGFSSTSYSRFGTSTISGPASNWITQSNDILVSGDLYGVGSLAFQGPASLSNTLWVSPGGSGNVGIGTSGPGTKLEVDYSDASTTTVSNGLTLLNSAGTNGNFVGMRLSTYGDVGGGAYPKQFIGAIRTAADGVGDIVFLNRNAGDTSVVAASDERMRITSTGNVGIGTTGPGAKLQISSGSTAEAFWATSSSTGGTYSYFENTSTGGRKWAFRVNGSANSEGAGTAGIEDITAGAFRLFINTSGSVGIGTTAPTAESFTSGERLLQIEGAVGAAIRLVRTNATAVDWEIGTISTGHLLFYDGNDSQAIIRADGSAQNDDGWITEAVDYGEFMRKLDSSESIEIYDVVGVKNGKITKNTEGATLFMVTATDAGIRGGSSLAGVGELSNDQNPDWLAGAFIGQMPVLVEGEVSEGDYIIPSGNNDGRAKAISKENITPEQFNRAIGVALEDSIDPVYEQYDPITGEIPSPDSDSEIVRELYKMNQRKGSAHIINVSVGRDIPLPLYANDAGMLMFGTKTIGGDAAISGNTYNISAIASGLLTWFKDSLHIVFEDGLVRVAKGIFEEITTKKLCVSDESGNKTCVTKAQLDSLLAGQNANSSAPTLTPVPVPSPTPTSNPEQTPESTPEPTPEPTPELTPEPSAEPTLEPTPESVPEPVPESIPEPSATEEPTT